MQCRAFTELDSPEHLLASATRLYSLPFKGIHLASPANVFSFGIHVPYFTAAANSVVEVSLDGGGVLRGGHGDPGGLVVRR